MASVGTMTLTMNADAKGVKTTLTGVKQQLTGFKKQLKAIGGMEIGEGSILSRTFVFLGQQIAEMNEDLKEIQINAAAAGETVEDFSKGTFTNEQVQDMNSMTSAWEDMRLAVNGLRAQALGPFNEELKIALDVVTGVANGIRDWVSWIQGGSGKVGTWVGNQFSTSSEGTRAQGDAAEGRRMVTDRAQAVLARTPQGYSTFGASAQRAEFHSRERNKEALRASQQREQMINAQKEVADAMQASRASGETLQPANLGGS